MAAVSAFRRGYVTPSTDPLDTDWGTFEGRRQRYRIFWSLYAQDAYDTVHSWATSYKAQYGLYKYVRNIYSPAYRLGEFYKSHVLGGQLDASAGSDGAIPIVTDNERIRPALEQLWRWSNWAVNKDVLVLYGATLGDVGLAVTDDPEHGRVRLEIVRPGIIKSVDLDDWGNVRGYVLEYETAHPERPGVKVTYTEQVYRESSDLVVYETYLNGAPYAWDGIGSSWAEPYGFTPFVLIQHNDVGLDWGWSEFQPLSGKLREVDNLASRLGDHIVKQTDPLWLIKGRPANLAAAFSDSTTDDPQPGRDELRVLWAGEAEARALVADMSLEDALAHLSGLVAEIERDYPELGLMVATASGDASGRALRVARQPAVSKVLQRRANYDDGLVRAQQMALAIGGWRGYDGYRGFDLGSYERGELDHEIGPRPVFEDDPLDLAELARAEWEAALAATQAGVSLAGYLQEQGWSDERISKLLSATAETNTEE